MLANSTGANNVAVGVSALQANTVASYNTAVGVSAAQSNTTGYGNTVIGYYAGYSNTTGATNTIVGTTSMQYNTTGGSNVAVGYLAMQNNTTASWNTAIGYAALQTASTGVATLGTVTGGSGYTNGTYNNVVMTYVSGTTATTYPTATIVVSGGAVTSVTITVAGAGFQDTTTVLSAAAASIGGTGSGFSVPVSTLAAPNSNVAVGDYALQANTVGTLNTVVGQAALAANTTGNNNTSVGQGSMALNTTGSQNIAIGASALHGNTTASGNIAIGYNALLATATGGSNISVGSFSLQANTTGSSNVSIGQNSLILSTTGYNNIAIGYGSGSAITAGNYNVILGGYTGSAAPISATGSNWVVLSDGAGNVRSSIGTANVLNVGNSNYAWTTSANAGVDIGPGAFWSNNTLYSYLTTNSYYSGTAWTAKVTGAGTMFTEANGTFSWSTAPSVSAGSAQTFSNTMTLDASGNLAPSGTVTATQFNGSGAGLTGTASSLTVGTATNATNATNATTATNVAGGAAGSIHYQSAANTTAMLAAGSGVLVESGGAPSWSLTPTLTSVTTTGFTALGNAVTQSAPSTTAIATTAALSVAENGGNGLWVGQNTSGNSFAVWMQSSFTNPTTAVYPMALNPLGGNVGINTGNTAPTSNLQVNGSIAGSTMSLSGGMYFSNAASVAAAGTTQGTATVLTADTNAVTSGTGGVVLPSGVGREITVINRTGSAVNVYPASGYSIDGAGTNAATSVPPNAWITVNCLTSTNYYTIDPVFTAGTGMSITQSNNGTVTFGVSTVPVGNGGTGITGTPANGQIPIGNGTNYTLATLTAGTNVTITNSAGSITINASGGGGSSPPGAQVVTALYFGAL